ncbi:MAG: VOC family protein [Actinomycetes bacterium]
MTGWTDAVGVAPRSLRHPSLRGPLLELCPERAPKGTIKNRLHLDIRLETADDPDDVAASIAERGGRELHPGWGELPWRLYADPSGNEFCVLPSAVVRNSHRRPLRRPWRSHTAETAVGASARRRTPLGCRHGSLGRGG